MAVSSFVARLENSNMHTFLTKLAADTCLMTLRLTYAPSKSVTTVPFDLVPLGLFMNSVSTCVHGNVLSAMKISIHVPLSPNMWLQAIHQWIRIFSVT